MKENFIKELNASIAALQKAGGTYEGNIGKGVILEAECGKIIKDDIPEKLKEFFPEDTYKIKGSIGAGRITKCPWVAIMNKKETKTTQSGIYLVFLFSKNFEKVYLSLAQGVTKSKLAKIKEIRDIIRNKLQLNSNMLLQSNDLEVDSDKYKESVIYFNEWRYTDNAFCKKLLEVLCDAYDKYMEQKEKSVEMVSSSLKVERSKRENKIFSIMTVIKCIKETGLVYTENMIKRYACSLMTKPFVILSGLAGSGKTQLALAFARAMSENVDQQLCVVPVGADWTNREPLLGYPNALKPGEYLQPESGVLQIMMRALRNPSKPYFLVLDEMNLSYVERYFADFLSALESHQEIPLWEKPDECDSEVPEKIALPKNLFIIGTINVDETTYMFSPKVLDRANVIEFKIAENEMERFLKQDMSIDVQAADGLCSNMGQDFVEKSTRKETDCSELAQKTLIEFFKVLKKVNAEFGYRSATEIYRFIANSKACAEGMNEDEILDAAIVQKLLPKLHGSRKKLEPTLKALWGLCMQSDHTTEAITRDNLQFAKFPDAADKIQRMMQTALDNGFTSFAEA